ncbi:hypothetical protein KO361_04510 [Candidatus Woesearchaeota archaeon]|nr:hypothetical protein [Candidatus Woesearchaeota archaeon]
MAKTISRDTPLAEITLRKYEKPITLQGRELIRKFCLSIGLLQPGDSRDVVVDVLQVFLTNKGKELSSTEVEKLVIENREKYNLTILGVAPSNIRRQILRLRDSFLIEKNGNNYRINEGASIKEIFLEKVEKYYFSSIMSRVKEYVVKVDDEFLKE